DDTCWTSVGVAVWTAPTLKPIPLLATPPTVTTTGPVIAPSGTCTLTLLSLHADGVATVPLNVTVLASCVAPKFAPEIVTSVPGRPNEGLSPVMIGGDGVTVKPNPVLAR